MKKALIFGVTGQDGSFLRKLLELEGISVWGVARSGGDERMDVSDRPAVEEVVGRIRPDYVFHLAAESSTSHSFLWSNHAAISTGTLAILDAVEQRAPAAKVLLVGSGLQFENRGEPLDESCALGHSTSYAVARNHSLFAGRYYRSRGLQVYFAYLFNHDSALRGNRHLNMKIALAAASAMQGSGEPLLIGDLDAEKEFAFAGDIAAALWTLLCQEDVFECVVGSGTALTVRDWVEACYAVAGVPWEKHVSPDPGFQRPYHRLVSNPHTIMKLGWRPKCTFQDLAETMVHEAARRIDEAHTVLPRTTTALREAALPTPG